MTSYKLLEAYNIDLSVDHAIEAAITDAAIADRVYASALESFDPAVESEYEQLNVAAMEAEAANTSWFDRIRNAVSKFVAAIGTILSDISRKIRLFLTKTDAKKAEAEAKELEEKARREQIQNTAKAVGNIAYEVGKTAVPKVLFGLIQDRPHGIYQTIMSVVSNATNKTSLQRLSNATDVALKASKTKEKVDNFKRGAYRFFDKALHPFSKQYGKYDTPDKQGKRAAAESMQISIKELQKSAQIAGSEASELEKAMRRTTDMLKKSSNERPIDGSVLNEMRRDITDVYNEAIDIIRNRTNAIRSAIASFFKSNKSDDTKPSNVNMNVDNEKDDKDTKTY